MADPTELTDEQIAEWGRLADAAAPGPWVWDKDPEGGLNGSVMVPAGVPGWEPYPQQVIGAHGMHTEGFVEVKPADAAFIAAARTAVPALVAKVLRLQARLDDIEAESEGQRFA